MKKLLLVLLSLVLISPALGQTTTPYTTIASIAALKAMTNRPQVVQVVGSNPGIFNLSSGACSAADDIFQVQPTSGTTVCYTRAASTAALGKTAPLFVQAYGAVCDGTTDDRVAIQAAIDATPFGGALQFPATQCAVSAANATYTLTASKPIQLVCAQGGGIKPLASVANTVATLYLYGHASNFAQTIIDGCFIGDNSSGSRHGGDGVVFDTTSVGTFFQRPVITNSFIQQSAGNGWGVRATNNVANVTGAFAFANLGPNNYISGGVKLDQVGDSISITKSIVQSSNVNPAIYISLINAGGGLAGNTVLDGLNVTGTAGGVIVDCAASVQIVNSELEQAVASTEANNAIVDVKGSVCATGPVVITGNQLQANVGIGNPTLIRVANSTGSVIDNNRIAVPVDYTPVVITSAATSTVMGAGNNYITTTTPVSNGSATTKYTLIKDGNIGNATGITLTLSNANALLSVDATGTAPEPVVFKSGQTGITHNSNVIARLASNAAGRNATLKFSDTIANSLDMSMLSGALRILSNGVPVFDLSSAGLLSTSTWNGAVVAGQYGGTGVANTGKTITLGGNLTTTGAFNSTFAASGSYTYTLPGSTSTLAILGANTFTGVQTVGAGSSTATTLRISDAVGMYKLSTGYMGWTDLATNNILMSLAYRLENGATNNARLSLGDYAAVNFSGGDTYRSTIDSPTVNISGAGTRIIQLNIGSSVVRNADAVTKTVQQANVEVDKISYLCLTASCVFNDITTLRVRAPLTETAGGFVASAVQNSAITIVPPAGGNNQTTNYIPIDFLAANAYATNTYGLMFRDLPTMGNIATADGVSFVLNASVGAAAGNITFNALNSGNFSVTALGTTTINSKSTLVQYNGNTMLEIGERSGDQWIKLDSVSTNALRAMSGSANADLSLVSKGSSPISLYGGGFEGLRVNAVASANRYVSITPSNGGNPILSVSAGSLSIDAPFMSRGYAIGSLPASPGTGARAHVTDQLTTCAVTGAALTGGGAVTCPVFYNGTAWVGG